MTGFFSIVAACLLWALDALIRYPLALGGMDPATMVFTEHLVLVLVFLPFLVRNRRRFWRLRLGDLVCFAVVGAGGSSLANVCLTRAFALADPSAVILIQKLQLVFAVVLARLVLGERIRRGFLFWGSVALAGAVLVSWPDTAPAFGAGGARALLEEGAALGCLLALVPAAAWGSATVLGKRLAMAGHGAADIMAGRFLMGFLAMVPFVSLPLAGAAGPPPLPADPGDVLRIVLMAVLAGLIGMYLYYRGLRVVRARVGAVAELFFPLFAVAANWAVLGAGLEPVQAAGGALVVLGSFMVQWRR